MVIRYFKRQSFRGWKLLTQATLAQFSLECIFGREQVNTAAINAPWNQKTVIPVLFRRAHHRDQGRSTRLAAPKCISME